MTCPHCGGTTAADARYCASCGRALALATVTASEDTTLVPSPARASSRSDHKPASASSGWLSSSDSISHGRFAPGTVLDGRYRIIGLLGKGGMGEVYRADDLRLGQPVALNSLPDAVASDPGRLAQFHNEVRTARQISHPNICRVHDIGEVQGHLFLSMELVDGEDLASSLRRIGRFPEDKATDIARQLCAGLAAAHEKGVLHRDLKVWPRRGPSGQAPENRSQSPREEETDGRRGATIPTTSGSRARGAPGCRASILGRPAPAGGRVLAGA